MSITLTIQVENGDPSTIDQDDVVASGPLTRNIEVATITDAENGGNISTDYTYQWFIIDKPSGSTASINTIDGFAQQKKIELDNINEWVLIDYFVLQHILQVLINQRQIHLKRLKAILLIFEFKVLIIV